MAKYITLVNGEPTLTSGNSVSSGAGDAGKLIELNGAGKLDVSMLPAGVVPETRNVVASENLAAGNVVNFHNSSGVKMRKADATMTGKEAQGFVLAPVVSGQAGAVYPEESVIAGLTGLTPGTRYFLATVAGTITDTPPSASGQVVQEVGYALSDTELLFRPRQAIILG